MVRGAPLSRASSRTIACDHWTEQRRSSTGCKLTMTICDGRKLAERALLACRKISNSPGRHPTDVGLYSLPRATHAIRKYSFSDKLIALNCIIQRTTNYVMSVGQFTSFMSVFIRLLTVVLFTSSGLGLGLQSKGHIYTLLQSHTHNFIHLSRQHN